MTLPRTLARVVLIGFNKCATRSFARLFEAAGHKVVHNKLRRPFRPSRNLGRMMMENLAAGRKVLSGSEGFIFYCDLVHVSATACFEGATAFREVVRDYPGTKLILNLRDREDWIISRLNHGHGEFAARYAKALGLPVDAVSENWRRLWDRHLADVRAFAADHPGAVIEFNIDSDDIGMLCARLPDYGLDPTTWDDTGRSRDRRRNVVSEALAVLWSRVRPRSQ